MGRRRINESAVRHVLAAPEQRHTVRPGRDVVEDRSCRQKISASRVRRFRPATCGGRHSLPDQPGREVLEGRCMKAAYDARTDTLSIILKADAAVAESDEDKPGIILDYDKDGNLISLEILDASTRVTEARRFEFETTG